MNERIDQIARECTEYVTGTIDGDFEKFDYKKFAQLITADLVEYLKSELDHYGNRKNYGPDDSYEGMRAKADAINTVLNHVKYHYSKGGV